VGDFAYVSAGLPICADLFGICDGGGGAFWRFAWGMDGGGAGVAVSSAGAGRA